MTDLVEFIEARLLEDERVALAATPGPWYEPGPDSVGEWSIYGDGWMIASTHYYPREDMQNYWPKLRKPATVVEHGNENAAHIARHDPARALREVEAKRRILADVVSQIDGMEAQINSEWGSHLDPPEPREHLPLLRLLAAPYADHPDYRSEWSPETVVPNQ